MNSTDPHDPNIEQFVARTLGAQPNCTAPQSLEARVLRELRARAALPWWRRAYPEWPSAARMAFILASVGFAGLVLAAVTWIDLGARAVREIAWLMQPIIWGTHLIHVASTLRDALGATVHSLPMQWVYGFAVISLSCYGMFLALSTAAYRTLFVDMPYQR